MTLHRRAIALLTGILTLQLTLLGDVAPCADVVGGSTGVSAWAGDVGMGGMDMDGMNMPDMSMADDASEAPDRSAPADAPCGDSLPSRDCDMPLDEPACAAMIACAPSAIGIIAEGTSVLAAEHAEALINGATPTGLSRSTGPESPPPRA